MINCIICGKPCPPSPQIVKNPVKCYRQRKTCSPSCHSKFIHQRMADNGYVRPKWSKIPIHYCITCNKPFHPSNNDSPRNPNIFCSSKCRRPKFGEQSPGWKGGRINAKGYIKVMKPGHHRADKNGYVFEHILVMEQHLNHLLKKGERVHHVNGNRGDNRLQNLQLLSSHCHIKCPFCGRKFNPPQGTFI